MPLKQMSFFNGCYACEIVYQNEVSQLCWHVPQFPISVLLLVTNFSWKTLDVEVNILG